MSAAVVLVAHGTVSSLDDLPELLRNVRHGRPAPPELVAEVRRRYEAIGGRSPLLEVTREAAAKLEETLGVPVRVAMRLFHPYPGEVLRDLAGAGVKRVVVLPLAQHSAHVYGDAVKEAARDAGLALSIEAIPNWGREPGLTRAFARAIVRELDRVPEAARARTALVLTAHSLPRAVIDAGDPYEQELRGSAEDVAAAVRADRPDGFAEHVVCFQSQGLASATPWLGPGLRETLEDLAARGRDHIVLAPIGFLADHVEILYDLDIEAKSWGEELGIVVYRSSSMNAGDDFVGVLASLAQRALGG